MKHYSNILIVNALTGLCPLVAPKRTVILMCFIFVPIVNILTCLTKNVETSSLHSHSYQHVNSNSSSPNVQNTNQNISLATNYTTTTASPVTILPHPTIAQPVKQPVASANDRNHSADTKIGSTDVTTGISNEKEFSSRIGISATSRGGHRNSNPVHINARSSPSDSRTSNSSPDLTTLSSLSDSDDSDDESRAIFIANTLPSVSSEESTTLASVQVASQTETISDKNVSQMTSKSVHRVSNDLQALEAKTSTSINLNKRNNDVDFQSKLPSDTQSSAPSPNRNPYNSALEAHRLWSSPPLHSVGLHQQSPMSLQTIQNSQRPELLESKVPEYDQAKIQQPSFDSLIPNASLLDLLHIIKHLNLMNSSSDNNSQPISDRLVNLNSNIDPMNAGPNIDSPPMHPNRIENVQPYKMSPVDKNRNHIAIASKNDLNESLQPVNRPKIVPWRKMNQSSPRGTPELLATLESASAGKIASKHQQQQFMPTDHSDDELALIRDTIDQSNLSGSKLDTKYVSHLGERGPVKKQPRHSLISPPYIANFDTGLQLLTRNSPINRASVSTLKDKITASNDFNNNDRQPMDSFKIGLSNAVKSQPSSSMNSKLDHPKANEIIYYSGSYDDQLYGRLNKKQQTNRQHKPPVGNQDSKPKSKVATTKSNANETPSQLPQLQSNISSDTNSKRGERDIYDHNHNQNRKAIGSDKANEQTKDENQELSASKFKHSDDNSNRQHQAGSLNQKEHKTKEAPYQLIDKSPLPSIAQPRPVKFPVKIEEEQILDTNANQVPAYLNDPHKKSYYWTPEREGMFLDDLSNSIQYPRQLTIGELARHHGITPLGLQHGSPLSTLMDNFNLNNHHYQSAVEDFGLSSESGFSEDYASFAPLNHDRDPPMIPHHGLTQEASSENISKQANNININNNSFKIDEQLKQKIAIKAIEAATRDPELSATLFGSLLNLAGSDQQDSLINPIGAANSHHLDQYQAPTKNPTLANNYQIVNNGSAYKNAYENLNPPVRAPTVSYVSSSSTTPVVNPLNHFAMMMPMATMQDNQHTNNLHQQVNSSSSGTPINLVITDLANRWALSRMPDLVPIPLAATVPGYLIRLPDGKILAAALTNLFSIQGIQRGPLTANYKNLINNKFKGLMKSSAPSAAYSHVQQSGMGHQYGGSVSDSNLQPTVVLPASHHYHYSPRFVPNAKNNQKDHRGGIFSRGVLSQLGLGARTSLRLNNRTQAPKLHSSGQNHKYNRHNNRANGSGGSIQSKPRIVKLASSSFPVPTLTDQELTSLPIANPNEPVFSFADESQLLDAPDYQQAATSRQPQINQAIYQPNGYSPVSSHQSIAIDATQQQQQQQLDMLTSSSGANYVNFGDKLNDFLSNSGNVAHFDRLSGLSGLSDELFNYGSKKRKSLTNFSLSKLGPLYQWLTSIRPVKLLRKDSRTCTEKI